MNIKYLSFLLLFLPVSLEAQTNGTLKGSVSDSSSRERIVGATVYDINDISNGITSDMHGNYELHLSLGGHVIACSVLGMNADTIIVHIDSSSSTEYNFTLYSESTQMQTLVISAGRYEQKLQDITVSMDVLKPELIENSNSTNMTQVLDQAPGLNILDGEPQIRGGSGFDFGVGSRVAILIDGLPALPGDGGRIDWDLFPLENVEQIEIIKGASSVTYGSSALSGSINIRTAYPTDTPYTSVSMYTGLYSSPPIAGSQWWTGPANFSGTSFLHTEKIGQFDLVLGGMVLYDHGYIGPPEYQPLLGTLNGAPISANSMDEKTGRFNFGLRYHPKKLPRLHFGLNGDFGETTNVLSLIWSNDTSGLYRAYPNTVILQDQRMFYLDPSISYISGSGFEQSLRGRFYYTDNVETNNPSNIGTVTYVEYQCTKRFYALGGLNVTAGLVMNQTYSHTDSVDYLGVLLPASTNQLQNYAGYAQLDKKFWNVLNLSAGFRDENFIINNGKTTSHPVFRSGMSLKLSRGTFLRCSYGQGYRFPSLSEKYLTSQFSDLSIFSNPNLQPETSWNAEIGIKQGFKIGNFMGFLDAAGFWQQYQNTIELTYGAWNKYLNEFGTYSYSDGFQYLNTGPTRVRGVDISLAGEGKISKDFRIDILGGYTYTQPQALNPSLVYATDSAHTKMSYESTSSNNANNILKYRFQNIAKLNFDLKYKKYSIGGGWTYYSFMQNIDEIFYTFASLASYGIAQYREAHDKGINVFDAHIGEQATKHLKIAFVVNNVFNLSYSLRPLKVEPPRTFAIRLTYSVG
ncbi:MAG TPA: TonB-dependent receptor [Bacteroidia bacterium]|nr:TonB-dependent receptor [Bacteroidia bacterium]